MKNRLAVEVFSTSIAARSTTGEPFHTRPMDLFEPGDKWRILAAHSGRLLVTKIQSATDECNRGLAANHLEVFENRYAHGDRNAERNAEPTGLPLDAVAEGKLTADSIQAVLAQNAVPPVTQVAVNDVVLTTFDELLSGGVETEVVQ